VTIKRRIANAVHALRGRDAPTRNSADYIASTVKAWEASQDHGLTAGQSDYVKLVRRFTKHVKVAASRNASAVAAVPIRVMRRKAKGSAFKGRTLGLKERKAITKRFDFISAKVYTDQGDMEEIVDPMHPAVKLFAQANPRDNGYDLIEQVQLGSELTGNGYFFAVAGPNKWPVELWPLQPQFVKVVPDTARFIAAYVYGRSAELEEAYPVEQITHLRFPNPTGDPYYGMGPLASCVADHDLSVRFTLLAHSMIDNGVQPGGILTAKGTTSDQRKEIETRVNAKYAGADKYGRIMVVSGEVEWESFSPGEKEMAFLQSAKDVREVIANAFDLPVALLTLDSAALATAKAAIPQWQLMAIKPRIMRMQSKLNEQLMVLFRETMGDDSLCVIFDECVDTDEAAEGTLQVSLYTAGVVTKNEARAELGLDPDEDGGDEYYVDGAPMATDTEAPVEPHADATAVASDPTAAVQDTALNGAQVTAMADIVAQVAQGQLPPDAAKEMLLAAFPLVPPETVERIINAVRNFTPEVTPEQQAKIEAAANPKPMPSAPTKSLSPKGAGGIVVPPVSTSTPSIGSFHEVVSWDTAGFIKAMAAIESAKPISIRKSLLWDTKPCACCGKRPHGTKAVGGDVVTATALQLEQAMAQWFSVLTGQVQAGADGSIGVNLSASSPMAETFAQLVAPSIGHVFQVGFEAGATEVKPTAPVKFQRPEVAQFLDTYTVTLRDSVMQTSEEAIRMAVKDGLAAGETPTEITARVRELLTTATPARAEMIAVTETNRALEEGRRIAWKASGVTTKRWLLSGDPCELCVALAAKVNKSGIGIDVPFFAKGSTIVVGDKTYVNDYQDVQMPPAHTRCMCSGTYMEVDDGL